VAEDMDTFIADLKRLVNRWKAESGYYLSKGDAELAIQIEAWVADAQRIIESYESANT
jgi:hypothetical protein